MRIKRFFGFTRYYIIFYVFSTGRHTRGSGFITIKNIKGKFFNHSWILDEIKNDINNDDMVVTITGWKEMTRNDFNEFNKKIDE